MKTVRKTVAFLLITILVFTGILSSSVDTYAKTIKFNITKAQMMDTVSKYSISVVVANKEQKFKVNKSEIEKFTINSKKYSSKKTKMTVKATFLLDRTVATVQVKATLKYQLKKSKWKLSSCKFTKTSIASIPMKGTWKGTYIAKQGQTQAKIVVDEVSDDGTMSGTFSFSATPDNPDVEEGSYSFSGTYDIKSGNVSFIGKEWIDRPAGYSMMRVYGRVELVKKKIVSTIYNLSIEKE